MEVPSDASSLIYLGKAAAFELIERIGMTLLAPPGVWDESVTAGQAGGYSDVVEIEGAADRGLVEQRDLNPHVAERARELRDRYNLGRGESEVLALGQEHSFVLIDEGRATKVAVSLGIGTMSTLLLPPLAVERGMTVPDALAMLRRVAAAAGARAETMTEIERSMKGGRG
jgi:predicted nucleic acid-binding protein